MVDRVDLGGFDEDVEHVEDHGGSVYQRAVAGLE